MARGYVYYVSLKGVTGAGIWIPRTSSLSLLKSESKSRLPIGVGFASAMPRGRR